MTKRASYSPVTNAQNNAAEINAALTAVNTQFDNTLSLDGSTPNQMEADLDLNSNDILNANVINTTSLKIAGATVTGLASVPDWKGAWLTTTAYLVNDIVREAGSTYICLVAHTSGTFSTDLSMNKWELFAQQGSAGAGSGDMIAANNLSDLANVATARSNLGLGTAATTAATAYATAAQGALADAALPLASVLDEDDFATDSATLPPSQQSVAAYVATEIASSSNTWTTVSEVDTSTGAGSYDVTSIPSGVTDIEIYFDLVSLSGNDHILVQLGDSGGVEIADYLSYSNRIGTSSQDSTVGFVVVAGSNGLSFGGSMELFHKGSNRWLSEHKGTTFGTTRGLIGSGQKTLSGTLNSIRITRTGTNTFDAGSITVRYR